MARKILIVEDNRRNRVLFRDILQYHGYDILEAENGAQCVKIAREDLPDLILLDIQMPLMDGFSALKVLRQSPETSNIKVIALTSFAMVGDREKIISSGFDGYLSKPIDTRKFPEMVRTFLENSTMEEGYPEQDK